METRKYYLVYFFVYLSSASIVSLMPVYLNENIKMEVSQVAFYMSLLPILNLLFQPVWGGIADSLGNRILVLKFLLIMTGILSFIIGLSESRIVTLLLFSLYTIFMCGQAPIKDSITLGYIATVENSSFGIIRTWGAIGFAVGAFGAGFIADTLGINWIFYLGALGFFLSLLFINNIENLNGDRSKDKYGEAIKDLIKNKVYIFILIYSFFFVGAFFSADQFYSLFVRHNGFSMNIVGTLLFIAVCVEIPFMFFSRKIMIRLGLLNLLLSMALISVIRLFYLGMSSSFIDFVITGILRGISVGIFIPLFIQLISTITKPKVLSSALSLYSSATAGIGVVVFTLLGGLVIDHYDYRVLFWFYGVVQSILFIPLLFNIKRLKKIDLKE